MAGAALLRRYRWFGRVWLVADHARCHGVVGHRVDLWEPCGTGGIVGVATLTELSLAGDCRLGLDRVRDVGCGRAVAGLTAYAAVIPRQTLVHYPAVAQCALLLAGVLLFVTDDAVERGRTEVPQFAEGIGDKKLPGEHKCDDDQNESDNKDGYLRWHRLSLERG